MFPYHSFGVNVRLTIMSHVELIDGGWAVQNTTIATVSGDLAVTVQSGVFTECKRKGI